MGQLKRKKTYSSRDRGMKPPAPRNFDLAVATDASFLLGACGFVFT